jgi:hypothetical protein
VELERRLALVTIGAWCSHCCYLDLYEIETPAEADDVREQIQWELDGELGMAPQVWVTEREALEYYEHDLTEYTAQIRKRLNALVKGPTT